MSLVYQITLNDKQKVGEISEKIVISKSSEFHHQVDNGKTFKRFFNGIIGELAFEKMFHVEVLNWHSQSHSVFFTHPDLSHLGLDCGIKTVEYPKAHIVFKTPKHGEVLFNIYKDRVYLLGYATKKILVQYSDPSLIRSPKLLAKGTKTGFQKYGELKKFKTLQELKNLIEMDKRGLI